MDLENARTSLYLVAQKHGIPEAVVAAEIERSIHAAVLAAEREKNTAALQLWKEIPRAGELPTASELVAYLCPKVMEEAPECQRLL